MSNHAIVCVSMCVWNLDSMFVQRMIRVFFGNSTRKINFNIFPFCTSNVFGCFFFLSLFICSFVFLRSPVSKFYRFHIESTILAISYCFGVGLSKQTQNIVFGIHVIYMIPFRLIHTNTHELTASKTHRIHQLYVNHTHSHRYTK